MQLFAARRAFTFILQNEMPTGQYFLRNHAFFCLNESFCFILDVKADQYFCIDILEFRLIATHLHGWSNDRFMKVDNVLEGSPEAVSLANDLVSRGILSAHAMDCKPARPVTLPQATNTLKRVRHRSGLARRASLGTAFLKAAVSGRGDR